MLAPSEQPGRAHDFQVRGFMWQSFLCVPLRPWWFSHFHFINHKGHEGTQRNISFARQ
jgi:hypothetical protein